MIHLPQAIAAYVDASNAQDPQGAAAAFRPDALVFDEGHTMRGRDQIETWVRESGERYQAVMEPTGLTEADGRHILRATVSGNFPGSPIALHFHFQLQSGGIQSLEIKP